MYLNFFSGLSNVEVFKPNHTGVDLGTDALPFDNFWINKIEFDTDKTLDDSTHMEIMRNVAGMLLNVPSGDLYTLLIAGTPEYDFSDLAMDLKRNRLDGVGKIELDNSFGEHPTIDAEDINGEYRIEMDCDRLTVGDRDDPLGIEIRRQLA